MKKQRKPDPDTGGKDTAAGQEGDRIDAEMSNLHDDFGKGRAKDDDGRGTARDVAERQGEKDG
jgi:hypothetical protein